MSKGIGDMSVGNFLETMEKGSCGKKFEFMEGDNIYEGICGEEDGLCQDCSQIHGSGNEVKK